MNRPGPVTTSHGQACCADRIASLTAVSPAPRSCRLRPAGARRHREAAGGAAPLIPATAAAKHARTRRNAAGMPRLMRANSFRCAERVAMESDTWDADRTVEDPWLCCAQPVFALQVPAVRRGLCGAGTAFSVPGASRALTACARVAGVLTRLRWGRLQVLPTLRTVRLTLGTRAHTAALVSLRTPSEICVTFSAASEGENAEPGGPSCCRHVCVRAGWCVQAVPGYARMRTRRVRDRERQREIETERGREREGERERERGREGGREGERESARVRAREREREGERASERER